VAPERDHRLSANRKHRRFPWVEEGAPQLARLCAGACVELFQALDQLGQRTKPVGEEQPNGIPLRGGKIAERNRLPGQIGIPFDGAAVGARAGLGQQGRSDRRQVSADQRIQPAVRLRGRGRSVVGELVCRWIEARDAESKGHDRCYAGL
jgi:hypothetical protein